MATDKLESKQNQIDKMFKISYRVYIDRKECPKDVIELLKNNNIKFGVWKCHTLKKEYYDSPEELSVVSLDPEIYNKLKKLSEITRISIKDIANTEFEGFLRDHVSDEPLIFLDKYLGIENVKDPIGILEELNKIVNISEKYLKWLKTIDIIEYVNNWSHPLQDLTKSNK